MSCGRPAALGSTRIFTQALRFRAEAERTKDDPARVECVLEGGIGFATPDPPGHLAKDGSVFKLHPEVNEKWLKWDPVLWRGPVQKSDAKTAAADSKDKDSPGPIARFFHHSGKSEEEASKDAEIHRDAPELDAHHKMKHGHLRPR